MNSNLSEAEVSFLHSLLPGESVEIFDEREVAQWKGVVLETAPDIGVAWIRTDLGERKLLDIKEHSVRRFLLSAEGLDTASREVIPAH